MYTKINHLCINLDVREERLGFINLDKSRAIIGKLNLNERKTRPVRLLPVKFKTSE